MSYKSNQVPPCLNADEAAHGYNAYSILKTGKDEYGTTLPLRLKSFGDYKLPLYSYFSIPFVAIFGTTDFAVRLLNYILGIAFIPLAFFLLYELFKNTRVAILGSFLVAVCPGLYILTRHAHEGVLCTFFILLSLYFFLKWYKYKSVYFFVGTNIAILLASFSYHIGRIFLVFFVLAQLYVLFRQGTKKISHKVIYTIFILIILSIPFIIDISYGANRVANLFFTKNIGFQLRINEYIGEHPNRLFHNKLTEAGREVINRYFRQISTDFFVVNGDSNWRFGMPNLGIITAAEYILFFIGLYYLFKNKEPYRYLILTLALIAPINNALTWQEPSLIRTYPIIFFILFIAAYGYIHLLNELKIKYLSSVVAIVIIGFYAFNIINNWDLYFNHYPKRGLAIRAWQCGYKEMTDYVKQNYNNYDSFVITNKNGQPYIYLLYYLGYDPKKYQQQARLSAPDEFGFGQVESFDKFYFNFNRDKAKGKTVYIGYPDDFTDLIKQGKVNETSIKKIKVGSEEMFWIYPKSI